MERIQKILAKGGLASRRAAELLITEGRVRVNGRVVSELGAKADPRKDRIEVDGKRVVAEQHVYIVLHKPRGVVATMSDPEGRPTVREILVAVGARVYPVGRLDFATSGVLLATNDGELADGLLHPKKAVPKTYIVKVKGKMAKADLDHWREGVHLEDGKTLPAEAKIVRFEGDKTWFELTIKEGRNQQIRRMGVATRFPVMRLARLAFAQITADGLRPGQWRHMTRDELVQLKKTYGVPRSIPAPPEEGLDQVRRLRVTPPRRGSEPRAARPVRGGSVAVVDMPKGPIGDRFTSRDRVAGADRAASADRAREDARSHPRERDAVAPSAERNPRVRSAGGQSAERHPRERDAVAPSAERSAGRRSAERHPRERDAVAPSAERSAGDPNGGTRSRAPRTDGRSSYGSSPPGRRREERAQPATRAGDRDPRSPTRAVGAPRDAERLKGRRAR